MYNNERFKIKEEEREVAKRDFREAATTLSFSPATAVFG